MEVGEETRDEGGEEANRYGAEGTANRARLGVVSCAANVQCSGDVDAECDGQVALAKKPFSCGT